MMGFNPNTWPTFQQSMPIAQGAMTGNQLMAGYLQNQMQKQQNQFQPDLNAARLAQMKAGTEGQQISNSQAPEMLALKEYLAQVSAENSATGIKNQQLQRQKMPALFANAMARLSNNPQMQSMLSDPDNPIAQQAMRNILAGSAGFTQNFSNAQSGNQDSLNVSPAPNFPTLQQFMGGTPANEINSPIEQQYAQQPIAAMPPNQQIPSQQQFTPEQIAAAQDATASRQIKQNDTTARINQRQYATNLEKFSAPVEKGLQDSSRYFGLTGKKNLAADIRTAKKTGNTPPSLMSYRQLMTVEIPNYASEWGRTLGFNATDQQKKMLAEMTSPNWIMDNPEIALNNFHAMQRHEQEIRRGLSQSLAQQQRAGLQAGLGTSQLVTSVPQAQSQQIEMVDEQGKYRMVDPSDVQAAIEYGWRRA